MGLLIKNRKIIFGIFVLTLLAACSERRVLDLPNLNASENELKQLIRSNLDSSITGSYFVLKTVSAAGRYIGSPLSNRIFLLSKDTICIVNVERRDSALKTSNVTKLSFKSDTSLLMPCNSYFEGSGSRNSRYVNEDWGNDSLYFHHVTDSGEKVVMFKTSDCLTDQKCLICEIFKFVK